MMNIKHYLILLGVFISCNSKSQTEKIHDNTIEILKIIKQRDYKSFRSKIAVKDISVIGKDEEQIEYEFNLLQKSDSMRNLSIDKFIFSVPDTLNYLQQIAVSIPLDYSNPELSNSKHMILVLYFGPFYLFPIDKISGYEIIFKK